MKSIIIVIILIKTYLQHDNCIVKKIKYLIYHCHLLSRISEISSEYHCSAIHNIQPRPQGIFSLDVSLFSFQVKRRERRSPLDEVE